MTLVSARTRIGRVKMKAGGADVRVIHTPAADTECRNRVRSWSSDVLGDTDPPHAFFAVALWLDPGTVGGVTTKSGWWSDRHELQYDMLPELAVRVIRRQITNTAAESNIMRSLGYSDESDPAA